MNQASLESLASMAATRAYLDYNASAPLLPSARAAMLAALETDANPSSVHAEGRAARRIVESARRDVAALCNAKPEHVTFTSGASEAASTLLSPDWRMGRSPLKLSRLYVSAADHPCILNGGRFAKTDVLAIGVDRDGILDLAALKNALAAHDGTQGPPLVAVHYANNETGVIQPVHEIGIARDAGAMVVLDAVQAAGRLPLDIAAGYADFFILSSHKIGGPKGAGAIVAASRLKMPEPLISGGGQEKGHRAGTENLIGIAGFAAAAREAYAGLAAIGELRLLRDAIESDLLAAAPDAVIFGKGVDRLANTSFFALPGVKAETAQIAFDLAGVALSAGSACSSGKVGPSHVLKAMGYGDQAGALRISIGSGVSAEDIALFNEALAGIVARRQDRTKAA